MLSQAHTFINDFIYKTRASNFVRNVATVGGGIAVAQAIALLFMPIHTRLYGPEAFGMAAAFFAVMQIITPLSTLGYANAIVMPEEDEEAAAIARLAITCALVMAPIALLVVFMAKPILAQWTGLQSSANMLYFIPLALIITALLNVSNQSAIRAGLFKPKARAYVESTLVTNINKLLGGVFAASGLMLIVLTLFGTLINFLMQIIRIPRSGYLKPTHWFGLKGIQQAARTQKDFAIYRMPQSVIRAVSMGLPVLLLTSLFGASYAGQYSLILLVLSAPVMLLGDSVGEVFYPKITRAINNKIDAQTLILTAAFVLFAVGCIPFGLIVLFGDVLLPWVFGNDWQRAGEYSQWVALWMIAMLAIRPVIAAMPALKIQSTLLIYELIITAGRIAAIYIGYFFNSDLMAIACFSSVNVIGYLGLFIVVDMKSKQLRNT